MDYEAPINGGCIQNWGTFHNEFQEKLGFFDCYGRNLNAWIDCMSDLYTNGEYKSLTKYDLSDNDKLVLKVFNAEEWRRQSPGTFEAFIECCIAANARRTNFLMVIK